MMGNWYDLRFYLTLLDKIIRFYYGYVKKNTDGTAIYDEAINPCYFQHHPDDGRFTAG